MNLPPPPLLPAPATSFHDILYVLFRHKWKIIICAALGFSAASAIYLKRPPPFQSEAKLFIRYVLDNSNSGMPGNDTKAVSPDQRGDTIINTEVAILGIDVRKLVQQAIRRRIDEDQAPGESSLRDGEREPRRLASS